MGLETKLLDIPVYRISEEEYNKSKNTFVENSLYPTKDDFDFYEQNPEYKIRFKDHLNKVYGGMWRYNEIIGYIRLYLFGTQIRGCYYQISQRRMVRTRKKNFVYKTHKLAGELQVYRAKSNVEFFDVILNYLADCKNELPKARFVDDRDLKRIGPFIDWISLYSLHQEQMKEGAC